MWLLLKCLQAAWQRLVQGSSTEGLEGLLMPSRLVTDEDLKPFYKAMMIFESSNVNVKRKGEYLGGLDTQQYGRGKRAREVGVCTFHIHLRASCLYLRISNYKFFNFPIGPLL